MKAETKTPAIAVVMTYARSTPGTHVYKANATGKPPAVPSLYIKRWVFDGKPPASIAVTIDQD